MSSPLAIIIVIASAVVFIAALWFARPSRRGPSRLGPTTITHTIRRCATCRRVEQNGEWQVSRIVTVPGGVDHLIITDTYCPDCREHIVAEHLDE